MKFFIFKKGKKNTIQSNLSNIIKKSTFECAK